MVSRGNTTAAASSSDGINWTARTLPAQGNWQAVALGNGTFVALCSSSIYYATSSNGSSWTQRTMPFSSSLGWDGLLFGNGLFVATESSQRMCATSADGVNWTLGTLPIAGLWQSIAYGDGLFVAISGNWAPLIATSPDGLNWTARATPPGFALCAGVAFGNRAFVAVQGASSNVALYSGASYNTATEFWVPAITPPELGVAAYFRAEG